MRSPRLYAVFLVGLGVVAAWLIIHRLQEPRYKGKSVRFWFSEFSQASSGRSSRRAQRAAEALQQLGPKAVRYLVDEAIRPGRDTPFRVAFYELLAQFPDSWHLPRYVRQDETRADAVRALQQLKPASTLLLPSLREVLKHPSSPQYEWAVYVLECAGDSQNLVPEFAKVLQAGSPLMRLRAATCLERLGPAATSAIPDITVVLQTLNHYQPGLSGGGICLGEHGHQRVVGAVLAPPSVRCGDKLVSPGFAGRGAGHDRCESEGATVIPDRQYH